MFQKSTRLRWKRVITLINTDGEISRVMAKLKISFLLVFLIRDVKLEYLSTNISKPGALKIALQRFIALTGFSLKEIIKQGFFFYVVDTKENSEGLYSLTISSENNSEVWVSRNAIVGGISASHLSRVIEYDLLRRKNTSRYLIWNTSKSPKAISNQIISSHVFPSRKLAGTYELDSSSPEVRNIGEAEVFGGNCVIVKQAYVRLHGTSPTHDVCWPSEVPTNVNGTLYLPQSKSSLKLQNATYVGHSHSWFHFIVEYLLYLELINVYECDYPLLIPNGCPTQIIELIRLLGFKQIIEIAPQESVFVDNLTIVTDLKRRSFSNFSEESGVDLKRVQKACLNMLAKQDLKPATQTRKVFLARDLNLLRGFSNNKEIQMLLCENGYEVIFPELLSAIEQFTLINECSHVVAESGAAITSLIFSKSQITFLELRPFLGESKLFWKKFVESIGHKHHAIDARKSPKVKFVSNHRSKLNLNALLRILNEI